MKKDCRETFESEFEPRGFAMSKDEHGYYTNPNADFAYRGWEAAWKYDEIRERIYNGSPRYSVIYKSKPREGFRFRLDEDGNCYHEEIPQENATNNSVENTDAKTKT